jgi:hypothetical protein
MTGPGPDDVAAAVRRLTESKPTLHLGAAEAAAVTPRLLRLARRPDQGADAFITKLRDLLGQEPAPVAATPRDAPTLDRLHGMDAAVAWGRGVAGDLTAFAAGQLPWSRVDGQGCLLSGPPGCGKDVVRQGAGGDVRGAAGDRLVCHLAGDGPGSPGRPAPEHAADLRRGAQAEALHPVRR